MEGFKEKLIKSAFEAAKKSYSPYSKYSVGAAILVKGGEIFTGCNVENASYGGTICAERTAALKAVYEGKKEFLAIAVVGYQREKGKNIPSFAYPCGICRQFLREFAVKDMKVFVAKDENQILETTLEELLPNSFGPEHLNF